MKVGPLRVSDKSTIDSALDARLLLAARSFAPCIRHLGREWTNDSVNLCVEPINPSEVLKVSLFPCEEDERENGRTNDDRENIKSSPVFCVNLLYSCDGSFPLK